MELGGGFSPARSSRRTDSSPYGFVLHYVIDNTQPGANLDEMLTCVPAIFQTAGLLVTGGHS